MASTRADITGGCWTSFSDSSKTDPAPSSNIIERNRRTIHLGDTELDRDPARALPELRLPDVPEPKLAGLRAQCATVAIDGIPTSHLTMILDRYRSMGPGAFQSYLDHLKAQARRSRRKLTNDLTAWMWQEIRDTLHAIYGNSLPEHHLAHHWDGRRRALAETVRYAAPWAT